MPPFRPLRVALALAVVLAATPAARADQFIYVDLDQARAALARLRAGDVVHHYCAPCGEPGSARMTVRTLGIDRVWDARGSSQPYAADGRTYWKVELNDIAVDLAYVYVREGRQWRNLTDLLGLQPWRVPAVLPRERIGTRWICGRRGDPEPGNPYVRERGPRRDPCTSGRPDPAVRRVEAADWR